MGQLLAQVVPLALGAAVSPAVIAVVVLTLSSPRRGLARASLITAGVVTGILLLTVLGLTVMSHVTNERNATRHAVSDGIDVVVGLLLLALALRGLLHAPSTPEQGDERPPAGDHTTGGLLTAFATGLALMATNFSTILLYLPAMKEITRSQASATSKAVAVVLAVAITSFPATVPLTLRLVAPTKSTRWLARLNETIRRHQHSIMIGVEAIFGIYLLAKGL